MEGAPGPINSQTPGYDKIVQDDENHNYRLIYKNGLYLKILLANEFISFIINNSEYELNLNYKEITDKIPNFKSINDINTLFNVILEILNKDKFDLVHENDKIKLIIIVMNVIGNEEKHEIILPRTEKSEINELKAKLIELENKIVKMDEDISGFNEEINLKFNKIIEEKNEMNLKIEKLKQENKSIKDELKSVNEKLNKSVNDKANHDNKNILSKSYFNNKLEFSKYNYDLLIYPLEKKNEILIYDKKNSFHKKILKPENFKCKKKFKTFPFKSRFVNLGKSLLLTGGNENENKSNKCYLISVFESKSENKIEKYEININSYGNLKEKRERHSIIYLPSKNYVFICSGFSTKTCEYTDLSKGVWEEIKPLNNERVDASMAFINERFVYIFCGSFLENENAQLDYLNDMEYFDINNFDKGWTNVKFMNDKKYRLSLGALGVLPVDKNIFLIYGGCYGKKYNNRTYKVDCKDYEHPTIEDINININKPSIFKHNLFCKIGETYFNFDFNDQLVRFDYKNLNIGIFDQNQIQK